MPVHQGRCRRARWWGEARPTFSRTDVGVVFGGIEKARSSHIYVQDIDSGSIRAISPEGVRTSALATHDSRYVFGWTEGRVFKYAPDGRSYCHDYVRFLSNLLIVEGLQ